MSKKILVIDDHTETVRLIEMTLRRHGYHVVGFESGADALAWAAKELPDLILLDLMMPDMDGHTVCRKLREDRRLRDVPVIVFTAKSEVQDKKTLFEAGANDYLVKPTRPSELLNRVAAILARNELRLAEIDSTFEQAAPTWQEELVPGIAVLGARGGVGATTVAINLAAALAGLGRPTTLVDLDVQQGHVALYLGASFTRSIDEWLRLPASRLAAALSDYLIAYDPMLDILPARPQPAQPAVLPPTAPLADALAALAQRQRMLVFDMGRNRGDAVMPLLQRVQHIVICIRSERAAISAARQIIEHLAPELPRPEALHIVLLESDYSTPLTRRAVEGLLEHPLFGVLTLDYAQIAGAIDHNLPLVRTEPESPEAQRFKELAEALVAVEETRTAGEAWKN